MTNPQPADDSVSRRSFLQAAGAASAAAATAPFFVHAADKAGTKSPVIGEGNYRYEADHHWGSLPTEIVWGETHGVAIDEQGMIYIKHRTRSKDPMDSIVVFDPTGKYVRSFGKEYHGGGHGIDIRKEGGEEFLYLTTNAPDRLVTKTNLKGDKVWQMQFPKEAGLYEDVSKFNPTNVAFSPDGGFYVADGYGSHYIHQYDKDAKWIRSFGGAGKEPGKFQTPHGLWLDNRPGREALLVVADRANARLQYFTLDGKPKEIVGGVSFPAHFDTRGEDLLVPDLHARVTIMNLKNEIVANLGLDLEWTKKVLDKFALRGKPEEWVPGKFLHPHDACFDKDGNIFVVEWVPTGRVTFLRKVS